MKAPAAYLESVKIEELAARYLADGYAVRRGVEMDHTMLDLVAERGAERIAIEVKARASLRNSAAEINELRTRALRAGFTEFRLVVVNPPLEKHVDVEGLAQTLTDYLIDNVPHELATLSFTSTIEGVSDLELDSVEVLKDGIHVRGSGSIDVGLESGGGEAPDSANTSTGFPFSFDLRLNRDLAIDDVHELQIDTSSFFD